MIRKARVGDGKEIQHLIGTYAKKGEMLPRSLSEIYDNLRDFCVYVDEGSENIIGICAMHICWEDLAEIRSLIVREEFWRKGIGTKLV
ncbi:MAG: GNAT family N-acetyltransferase, partial [Pseudomonadota bacterium]